MTRYEVKAAGRDFITYSPGPRAARELVQKFMRENSIPGEIDSVAECPQSSEKKSSVEDNRNARVLAGPA